MNISYFLLLFFGCITTLLFKNAKGLHAESIVGGHEAELGEYRYQVSIENDWDNICGGGIIGDRYVLTAAHCTINLLTNEFNPEKLIVIAGTGTAKILDKQKAIRAGVDTIYIPKEFNSVNPHPDKPFRTTSDIAVLKLNRSLELDSNPMVSKLVLPKKMTSTEYPSYVDENAIITGFGYNWIYVYEDQLTHKKYEYGGGSTDKLRYAETKIIDNNNCMNLKVGPIHPSHMCAFVKQHAHNLTEGVCSGDSGSPMVYKGDTVIGILVGSPTGCKENIQPAVYTRVSSYVTFIENVLNGLETSDMRIAHYKN